MEKSYQYFGPGGKILWTKWFPFSGTEEKIQFHNGKKSLLNRYRDETKLMDE